MKRQSLIPLFLVALTVIGSANGDEAPNLDSSLNKNHRQGRLFFGTTTTTTSTFTTASFCFVTTGTISGNCRKKRWIVDRAIDEDEDLDFSKAINPAKPGVMAKLQRKFDIGEKISSRQQQSRITRSAEERLQDLARPAMESNMMDSPNKSWRRQGRFLYLYTTTTTSTTTSFSATTTVTLANCTPSGASNIVACG